MPNKMLIDAAHPEETRVVVLRGNRVEEFDFESASRKQLRGNIYLAKVTRVEPSLQAAFVEYGGNRHGFLAFSEIHPDYYQIPVADRQALIEAEEREAAEAEERHDRQRKRSRKPVAAAAAGDGDSISEAPSGDDAHGGDRAENAVESASVEDADGDDTDHGHEEIHFDDTVETIGGVASLDDDDHDEHDHHDDEHDGDSEENGGDAALSAGPSANGEGDSGDDDHVKSDDEVESVGQEDALEEVPERRRSRPRQYKIQEVIKRRQVILIQVVKEERGNKGAALTTYLSLAGRYCVLMPNTARGGGISRKITSVTDRKRLKQVVSDLEVPQGMGVILRTAGASRTRAEVKRDFEYLLRLWENVRELTLQSSAPALVYEEGSLIKRSIRDLYNKDIDEVIVSGEDAYREAKDFMRMLMPSHAKNVQPYRESSPLFARSGIEAQLDAMFSPQVTLKSGGYIVINQTEALVSIDVNSGRSTREHNIEDTAVQTNLEAADEVARQLRLRDLAGLIVIDFIDMEEKRNNRAVERRLKDALKNDRARIQVGRISHFGLMEMSRQRIRTGVLESTTTTCPTCQGTGHVRAPASVALHVLRALEDQLLKGVTHHLTIRTRTVVALYILNQKRQHLAELEARFGLQVTVAADETITNGAHFAIERGDVIDEPRPVRNALITPASVHVAEVEEDEDTDESFEHADTHTGSVEEIDGDDGERSAEADTRGEREGGRRRRRRRGRGRSGEDRSEQRDTNGDGGASDAKGAASPLDAEVDESADSEASVGENGHDDGVGPDGEPRKRRRGRRGGRRGRRGRGADGNGEEHVAEANGGDDEAPTEDVSAAFSAYALLDGADEIDTTPTIEDSPAVRPQVQSDFFQHRFDTAVEEIDTTPMPEPRSSEPVNAEIPVADVAGASAEGAPVSDEVSPAAGSAAQAEQEPEDDPNRPKRSGWWQRRSFFG